MLEHRQGDEGRPILARSSPSTNMTWTSMGTTNCCLCPQAESTLRNFCNLLTSSARWREEFGDASCT